MENSYLWVKSDKCHLDREIQYLQGENKKIKKIAKTLCARKDKYIRDLQTELEGLRNEQDLAKKKYRQAVQENFTLAQRNQQLKNELMQMIQMDPDDIFRQNLALQRECQDMGWWNVIYEKLGKYLQIKLHKVCSEASKLSSTAPPPTKESLQKFVDLVVNEPGKMKKNDKDKPFGVEEG
ncbi:hypothetical protein ACFE04_023580 [Oxalis oulophora]